ncbi:hypothetical protein BC937DRAFT_93630 [Endogone sp. FLAS-F59071]|nr:hypothetical protein BC937DRAFT_93630 [Endogone sp. FLAS-F59071]|eukprot:RUS14566.1 hypothetical protein BC937DRAFT_93630 [Endogone sp. FLAS-F59071]
MDHLRTMGPTLKIVENIKELKDDEFELLTLSVRLNEQFMHHESVMRMFNTSTHSSRDMYHCPTVP